jgi:hypothetical protein
MNKKEKEEQRRYFLDHFLIMEKHRMKNKLSFQQAHFLNNVAFIEFNSEQENSKYNPPPLSESFNPRAIKYHSKNLCEKGYLKIQGNQFKLSAKAIKFFNDIHEEHDKIIY